MRLRTLRVDLTTLLGKSALQGAEQKKNERLGGTGAHQPDAPDFSSQRSEASANLYIEFREEVLARRGFVDTVRNAYRIERPETLAWRRQDRQAQFLQAVEECVMMTLMTSPPRLETLFFDKRQRLV